MIAELTHWIMDLLAAHGPLTVFVGVLIESVIIPIPSPLIIMGAGALLIDPGYTWSGAFWPILARVVVPGSLASTIGAYFTYALSYWGGKPLINRYQRFIGFNWDDVLALETRLSSHANVMIFALRAVPIVPLSLVSAAAGGLRLPFWSFTWSTLAGSIPRCLLLGYLGFLMRDSYEGFAGRLNKMESIVSGVIVVAAFALIVWMRKRMKR